MKKVFLLLLISLVAFSTIAHEFWLQPDKFIYQPGEDIRIRFWVGEDFDGSNWQGNRDKVKRLQVYTNDIKDDVSDALSDQNGDSLLLGIYDDGTVMIAYHSTNSFIQLDAAKFNDYLKEDGLLNALNERKARQEMDSSGKEYYQRSVKTLVQVGKEPTNICMPTDLPLDIIPLNNPYAIQNQDSLFVKVLFNKAILPNQLVKLWHRQNGKTLEQNLTTNENGELAFAFEKTGKWMLSTVKMMRLENDETANWQSFWGSCTWGYE
jgi:uncharacterized GH25 family protein